MAGMDISAFLRKHAGIAVFLLAAVMVLAFQGSRGLIEPDEGRYTNVALQILQHDDWISLYRNRDSLHFTKPPLTYWSIAASVSAFGHNEWAVRLPMALALLASVMLAFRLGRLFMPARPWLPPLFLLASPVAYLAANTVNTDSILAALTTAGVTCYALVQFGGRSRLWLDAMWLAFGLAFLTKGPPALLPLLAVAVFAIWHGQAKDLFRPLGILAFVLVGLGWYAVVVQRHPGLLEYFLGHEVVARIASDTHKRHSQWYGAFEIYVPTLLLGTLPALAARLAYRRQTPPASRDLRQTRFLWLWLLLPLTVFFLAKSRLPLYILGLMVPATLLLCRRLEHAPLGKTFTAAIAVWLGLLLALKGLAPVLVHDKKDSREFSTAIRPLLPGDPRQFVFVEDMSRNGLNLYFGADIKKVSFTPRPKPISDSAYDSSLAQELAQPADARVFIFKREIEQRFLREGAAAGIAPRKLGEWIEGRKPGPRDRMIYTLPGEFDGAR